MIKDVLISVWQKLRVAYDNVRDHQMRLLEKEIALAKAEGVEVDDLIAKLAKLEEKDK